MAERRRNAAQNPLRARNTSARTQKIFAKVLRKVPSSFISPLPSSSLGSGFARLRLARAALRFRVPLFEGRCWSLRQIRPGEESSFGRADDYYSSRREFKSPSTLSRRLVN